MRFSISLCPERGEIKLPYNYNYYLASAIYSFLAKAHHSFSDFLHDEGYSGRGKTFKLFTFSPLLTSHRQPEKMGLILRGRLKWLISSPKEEFLSNLVAGIFEEGFFSIYGHKLLVESVEVVNLPSFREKVAFHTLSPIVISTGERRDNRTFIKKYLSPVEPKFYQVFEENLRRKYQACYGKEPSDARVFIEFDQDFISKKRISKLIDFKGIKIRGYMAPFTATGNPQLIHIGYEAGFGENNSAGFGMVEVV